MSALHVSAPSPLGPALEQHYTVHQIAEAWGISAEKVRRLFQDAPGVLKIESPNIFSRMKKRPHVTLRIPASVLARFHEERSAGFSLKIQRGRGAV
jgi:hypothetical protein